MKIATWNINSSYRRNGETGNYDVKDSDYICAALAATNPDIVFLQELNTDADGKNSSELRVFSEELGLRHLAFHPQHQNHMDEGKQLLSVAILSKYPLRDVQYRVLRNPELEIARNDRWDKWTSYDKGVLTCYADVEGRDVYLVAGHLLPFWAFNRSLHEGSFIDIRKEIDDIVSDCETPMLAGFDANDNDFLEMIPKAVQKGVTSLVTGKTYRTFQSDYLLASSHWELVSGTVTDFVTDHYLCVAEVII